MEERNKVSFNCFVITVSDTRMFATDKSGALIEQLLTREGHEVTARDIVKDEPQEIETSIKGRISAEDITVILLTGGTGIAQRDVTIEVVERLIKKEIPGFGELFRMLSYTEDIGSAAMMSRAVAGVIGRTVIFAMPGSSGAVSLAMNKLILPELHHIISELQK